MANLINSYLKTIWLDSAITNNKKIHSLIEASEKSTILDIGCASGGTTKRYLKNTIIKPQIFGIDIKMNLLRKAHGRGLSVILANAEHKLPFQSNSFDIAIANQIIEHLVNIDTFVTEIYRVLKPKGYAIISTENLSSWHNLSALLLGWQAFSQHISLKRNIGNPLRLGTQYKNRKMGQIHFKIFTSRGLKEILEINNFKVEGFYGAGYYPSPPILSKILSHIDPVHSAFIGCKARKTK